jgi:hypothetical protein
MDGRSRYPRDFRCPLGRVLRDALEQQLMDGLHASPIVQREFAVQRRIGAFGMRRHGAIGEPVPPQRLAIVLRRAIRVRGQLIASHQEARVVAGRVHVDEMPGVGEACEELTVEETEGQNLVDQREQERTIGAGSDRHPLVRDRRIAGADRIDRDEAAAVSLELRDRDLERVRVVILGGADHHEKPRPIEVRAAELPERPADRVDHSRGHVDRAEAAVRCVVRRAELAREKSRERLHLVAAGEHREALGIGRADLPQALLEHLESLVPAHLDEFPRSALGAGLAQQRLCKTCRRVLLHDPRAALRADHPLVDRVLGIAFDVADFAVAHVHANAAAARAHVAGRVRCPGGRTRKRHGKRIVDRLRGHRPAI